MVIVFDLDDTLYDEMSFVKSGFQAVAEYLSPLLNLPAKKIEYLLLKEMKMRRDHVFDRFFKNLGITGKKWIKDCVRVYRSHEPVIKLYDEAKECLIRFQKHPIYIVTDGNSRVQRKKALALGLQAYMKRALFTDAYGLHRRKPSPYCFDKICQLERVEPTSVVYIADNPHKDFVGIKPFGYRTIRVMKGPYKNDRVPMDFDAEMKIAHLGLLDRKLLMNMIGVL